MKYCLHYTKIQICMHVCNFQWLYQACNTYVYTRNCIGVVFSSRLDIFIVIALASDDGDRNNTTATKTTATTICNSHFVVDF